MKLTPAYIRSRILKRVYARKELRLTEQGWYRADARSELNAIFIGGCGRSGTTLFKELLNRHSSCACGPETSMYGLPFNLNNIAVPWDMTLAHLESMRASSKTLIEFADKFADEFLSAENKKRWVEKTPNNVRSIDRILTWYPQGRFIHVIRDGRDVVCSLRNHPRERVFKGKLVPVVNNNSVVQSANRWLSDTMRGLAFQSHPRYLEVRYESLVRDPRAEMKRVCDFIGEPFEDSMFDLQSDRTQRRGQFMNNERASSEITSKSIGRWEKDLSMTERSVFCDIAGELLVSLGYVSDHTWRESTRVQT